MAIGALLDVGANESRFGKLAEKFEARNINFFVGAGLSIPCGMPGWTAFLQLLSRQAFVEPDIALLLSAGKYEEAAELSYRTLEAHAFEEALVGSFGPAEVPPERIHGPVIYLPELLSLADSNFIITTNFDRVIETVFRIKEKEFSDRIFGVHPDRIRGGYDSRALCLLKLHGDVFDPIGRVLRKREYSDAYGGPDEDAVDLDQRLPNALFTIFHSRSMLFLGCSLHRDRTLTMLKMISSQWSAAPGHYAILEDVAPNERDRAERDRHLLNGHNISAIWYPRGEHQAVDELVRELCKRVSGHMARGLRPDWVAFAFGFDCPIDILDRDDLCESDFAEGKAIRPGKLRKAIDAISPGGSPVAGKHVAISGVPGSGKSALAAWIDYTLCEQGKLCAYFEGKQYQGKSTLQADVAKLPRNSIVIIDDVHLVRSQVESLWKTRAMTDLCLVLLGRPAIFQEMRAKLPRVILIELSEKDGSDIGKQLAAQHYRGAKLKSLLARTQSDLVFTKWMLSGEKKGMAPTHDPVARAAGELEIIHEKHGASVLQAFIILACFRALELPCRHEVLVKGFACDADAMQTLTTRIREAVLDDHGDQITLQRHPKLAGLFARAADRMKFGRELAFSPLCRRLGVSATAVNGFASWSLVLGAMVAKEAVRMGDLVDRLIYGSMDAKYEEVAFVAAEFELNGGAAGNATHNRRLELASAAANGMRRVSGGEAAQRLLHSLREKLGVREIPEAAFEQKGYVLYQEAYLAWLNNDAGSASHIFEDSAKADEQFADASTAPPTSSYHRAKALMSRVVGIRMMVETLAVTSPDGSEPALDATRLGRYADQLNVAADTLSTLEDQVNIADRANVRRFRWNALIHLAQTRAWLGDERRMKGGLKAAGQIDLDLGRDRTLADRLARAQLAFVHGNYAKAVSLLRQTPQIMLKEKAGETSGLRAQLLARAHKGLGQRADFEKWCGWLKNECPRDASNGPAIDWAQAAISREWTHP